MKQVVVLLGLIALSSNIHAQEGPETEALRVLDKFMPAFNAGDIDAMARIFHYPHIRIASEVSIWNTPEDFRAARNPAAMEQFRKSTGWHHSAWDQRAVVQSSDTKVHFAVRFTRYRQDGSVISAYDSLWIVTKRNMRWGIQARSSFAP
jgi:hypothetical protein